MKSIATALFCALLTIPAVTQVSNPSLPINIVCGNTSSFTLPTDLEGLTTSSISYIEAGEKLLKNLLSGYFSCDQSGPPPCTVGCNLSERLLVEDTEGNPVDLSPPFDPNFWELAQEGGLYALTLTIPEGYVLNASCTQCRD